MGQKTLGAPGSAPEGWRSNAMCRDAETEGHCAFDRPKATLAIVAEGQHTEIDDLQSPCCRWPDGQQARAQVDALNAL